MRKITAYKSAMHNVSQHIKSMRNNPYRLITIAKGTKHPTAYHQYYKFKTTYKSALDDEIRNNHTNYTDHFQNKQTIISI